MLVSTIDYSPYLGRLAIGRVERGIVHVGDSVTLLPFDERQADAARRVTKLYGYEGLERVEVQEASAGEIVLLAGLEDVEIGSTLTDPEHQERARGHHRRGADDQGRLRGEQLAVRRQGREVRDVASGA